MSPRVTPRERRSDRPLATIAPAYGRTDGELVDHVVWAQERARAATCSPTAPYSPTCELHSFFRDLILVADSEARSAKALESPVLAGRDLGDPDNPHVADELPEARQRLEVVRRLGIRELRDLTSSAGAGGEFVPTSGPPLYLADAFAASARAQATLAQALPTRPMPTVGAKIEVPRFATGAAVAVQASDNSAVQETDPTTALASSAKAYIAGLVDVSRQLFDFARPGMDEALARDLGAALALEIDRQLVAGTNTAGQTRGLANVAGINTVTYTDASPTVQELVSKIWAGFQAIAEAGGGPSEPGDDAYLVVMAPRRAAFLAAGVGSANPPAMPALPGRIVASPGIRTNLGAGTNEDEIYVLARDESFICLNPPALSIYPEVGSSTLTVRIAARQVVAAMFARQPKSIARVSGTGLAAPSL